jgi:hypothetical protein
VGHLILLVIVVEKAMRAAKHDYHLLWAAGKLAKCVQMAGKLGFLHWE